MSDFRPKTFRLNKKHSLSKGLQLFLGGQHPGAGTAFDSGPFGSDGTLVNGAYWAISANSWAMDFDSVANNCSAEIPWGLHHGGEFTAAMWCYLRAGQSAVITQGDSVGSAANKDWEVIYWDGKFRFYVSSGATSAFFVSSASPPEDEWISIAVRWDGTTNADSMKLFVNGVQDATTGAAATTTMASNWDLYIGGGSPGVSTYTLDGMLRDVFIYNRGISDSEIQLLASPDPTYGGLLQPIQRRQYWFFSGGAAPPAASYWMWSRQSQTQLIGGGGL